MRWFSQSLLGASLLAVAALSFLGRDPDGLAADSGPPTHKGYVEAIPGTPVKFEMVPIPGGTFLMGSPATEKGRADNEGPQHPVTLRPFWMGKLEVSWDEYDCYWKTEEPGKEKQAEQEKANEKDPITRPTPPYADETFGRGREGYPLICVTHHAAMEYCRWLSLKTGKTYRLPTEAEWEYACRAGTKTAYSLGDDPQQLGDYAWFEPNSEESTHEIGKKKANPWGLYDMHGNVAEWCLDHYKKDSYAGFPTDKPALSPVLVPTETRFSHVARGGSWTDKAEGCRSAARRGSEKNWIKRDPQRPQSIWWLTSAEFVGFRVVRPVAEQENLKNLRSKVTRESP